MAIAFVNVSAVGGVASATSQVVPIPSGRVAGNILVIWIRYANAVSNVTINNNWTFVGQSRDQRYVAFWRIVDGTEVAPTVTWTTSMLYYFQCAQFSGVSTVTPVGNYSIQDALDLGNGNSILIQQVPSTAANSVFFAILMNDASNTVPPTPAGWTACEASPYSDSNGSTRMVYQTKAGVNTFCDAANSAIGNNTWGSVVLELCAAQDVCPQIRMGWSQTAFGGASISGTTGTITLPANRKTGDLLLAIYNANLSGTWSASWTVGAADFNNGGTHTSWAFAYVTGSEVAPIVTFSSSTTGGMYITAIAKVPSSSPIGATSANFGNSTTATGTPISTIASNSLILGLMQNIGSGPTNGAAVNNYISLWWQSGSGGGAQNAYATKTVQGSSSDAYSVAISPSTPWAVYMIEIPGIASPIYAHRNYIAKGQAS